ncbi:MAG: hypothetical protein R2681_01900 [Pyrinomonadaceae bacterium]
MSRAKSTIVGNKEFIERFIEVCGTSKPAESAQLFNISYQAAKNYLDGRLPETSVLINIGKNTSYSIHWLLTGYGPKFARNDVEAEPLSADLKTLILKECEKNVALILNQKIEMAKEKVLVLKEKDIKEERVLEESNPISLKVS